MTASRADAAMDSVRSAKVWGRAVFWPVGARWRGLGNFTAVVVAYVGVALLYPYTESGGVALLWLPNAVLITALLRFRMRDWPYVYAAGLLAEIIVDLRGGISPVHALYFGVVNVAEATVYVVAATAIAGGRHGIGLRSVRGTAAVIFAALFVPAVTAGLGAFGSIWAFGADYLTGWRTWWFGDAVGLLVGVPIGLLLRDGNRTVAGNRRVSETLGVGLGVAVLAVAAIVLAQIGQVWGAQVSAIAAGVLLALAFGALGAPAGAVLMATITLIGLANFNAFASAPQEQALLFVAVSAFYAIAATTESAGQAEQKLRRQRRELIAAKQELNAEKERFESVVSNSPSAISVLDIEGRYTMVNEAFCQLFGQKAIDDVIGRTEDELLAADVLLRSQEAWVRLSAGEAFIEEESIQRGPEALSITTQRFPLRNKTGHTTEMVTIRTDVTTRKEVEREIAERAYWRQRLDAAIRDDRLLVFSQPIVDVTTGTPASEELLVRLRPEDDGELLMPSQFLPQCERHRLMPVIDQYMARRAIEFAQRGRAVNVNITGQTVADASAMEVIFRELSAAGPQVAGRITFEITETIALASPVLAKTFSAHMRERGCRVALDDFGTGYGTFTELRHLALHALKIDRSFVRHILDDRDDERVVSTIIFVAKTYGLKTVAEGVESQVVLDRLVELGAECAQGYLFGRPSLISV